MNKITGYCQRFPPLLQGGIPSITNVVFQRILFISTVIASMSRLDCVRGFFNRASSSMRYSLQPTRTCSTLTPCPISSATAARMRTRRSISSIFHSSSSLAMSKSISSSGVGKSLDGDFYSMSLSIPTMEVMEEVGALIAVLSKRTDVLFLDGDLGAGKTTFSRGFIKCKLGVADETSDEYESDDSEVDDGAKVQQSALRITSPTYLLSNTYEYREDGDDWKNDGASQESTREIHHMDLYRLSGKAARDFDPLDLGYVFSNCISLIEWPSRLKSFPELLPPEETLLKIDLRIPDPTSDERVMSLVSSLESSWTTRLKYLIGEGMVDDLLLYSDDDDDDDDDDGNIYDDNRVDDVKE